MESTEIEIRVQALRKTLGFVDHYYMVIGDKEYHPGYYKPGCILPRDSTKGYHLAYRRLVCRDCLDLIVLNFNLREDKRMLSFYPFLNCESLTIGFSIQSAALCAVPFVGLLLVTGKPLYAALFFLCVITALLLHSKYIFSRTGRQRCPHIRNLAERSPLHTK